MIINMRSLINGNIRAYKKFYKNNFIYFTNGTFICCVQKKE